MTLNLAVLCLGLAIAWVDRPDGVAIPNNHPANPSAQPAPPIAVPGIQAPNLKDVTAEPTRDESRSPRTSSPNTGAPMHQHDH